MFQLVMITRHEGGGSGSGSDSGSGSRSGVKLVDEGLCDFIASEITRGILDSTPVIFGSIMEGMIELKENCLGVFRSDMAFS